MVNDKIMKVLNETKQGIVKNSPEILLGIGIAGFISTTVLAVKATPKALKLIEDETFDKDITCSKELTTWEKVKVAWKPYIPAAVTGAFSTACVISSRSINAKRNAALATAYKLSQNALTTYKEKVIETIGEKKEKEIQGKVNQQKLKDNPNKEIVIVNGQSLCYDSISGRYFESDVETIKNVINKLNRHMTYDMYVSLTELYDELGLTKTKNSDDLGWNLDDGLIEIKFDTKLCEDGKPAIVLDYYVTPKHNYDTII